MQTHTVHAAFIRGAQPQLDQSFEFKVNSPLNLLDSQRTTMPLIEWDIKVMVGKYEVTAYL